MRPAAAVLAPHQHAAQPPVQEHVRAVSELRDEDRGLRSRAQRDARRPVQHKAVRGPHLLKRQRRRGVHGQRRVPRQQHVSVRGTRCARGLRGRLHARVRANDSAHAVELVVAVGPEAVRAPLGDRRAVVVGRDHRHKRLGVAVLDRVRAAPEPEVGPAVPHVDVDAEAEREHVREILLRLRASLVRHVRCAPARPPARVELRAERRREPRRVHLLLRGGRLVEVVPRPEVACGQDRAAVDAATQHCPEVSEVGGVENDVVS
eukprot:3031591-Rhodomonas_salina.3